MRYSKPASCLDRALQNDFVRCVDIPFVRCVDIPFVRFVHTLPLQADMMDMKEDMMNDIVDDVMGAEEDEEER